MLTSRLLLFALITAGLAYAPSSAAAGPLDSPGVQKALVCSACHGFAGNSPGNTVPVIAGMAPNYFKKAIKDYAEGRRLSPEMEPYSKYVLQSELTTSRITSPCKPDNAPQQRLTLTP
jgi:cytochrome c553